MRLLTILIKILVLSGLGLSAHRLMRLLQTGKGSLHRVTKSGDGLSAVPLVHLYLLTLAELAGGLVIYDSVKVT